MNRKKKLNFKILNRENPELERLRKKTFEVAKMKACKRELFDDSGKRCIDPLILKEKEDFRKDLDYTLGDLPERYRHLRAKDGKDIPKIKSKKGHNKL